jgi:hypothetical protein
MPDRRNADLFFAADPCEVVLCMYGKATGNSGGSECSSAERAFLISSKKTIVLPKTFDMRKNFWGMPQTLNQ